MKLQIPKLAASFIVALMFLTGSKSVAQDVKKFEPTFTPFFWGQASVLNDETDGKNSSFQLKRSRIGAKGMVHEKIGYHFMVEGLISSQETRLLQAWINYKLHPLADIRIGQFKYPFGIEAYPGFINWKFINNSFVTVGFVKELGRKNSGESSGFFRDVGAQLAGVHKFNDSGYSVGYKVMLMNGNGILKTDNNEEKDVVLHTNLGAPLGINFGVSYFKGTFENDTNPSSLDESAFGFDFTWQHKLLAKDFRIQGEYMRANYKTAADDIEPWGFYIYGTCFVIPKVELGLRYDYYESNDKVKGGTDQKRMTLSAGYYVTKYQRINLNYEVREDDMKYTDNLLAAQFQIAF